MTGRQNKHNGQNHTDTITTDTITTDTITGNPLGDAPVGPLLRGFAIPSIIAMMVGALYNMVDQLFIGQSIGELGNAATNVAFPLSNVSTAIALLLGIGAASAFNLSMGRGEKEKALYYIGNAAVLLFGGGVLLWAVSQAFLDPMLRFFGAPQDVMPYARTYVRIVSYGFPFLILSNGGAHLVRADGSPRYSMLSNLAGAAVNTVLDPLFIFGLDMGMAGAALATILGQMLSGLLVFRYLRHYHAGPLRRTHLLPRAQYAGYAMSLGTASFFNQLALMVVQIVMNNTLTFYGAQSAFGDAIPLACAGIISKVSFVFFAVNIGISQGMQPIASFNYGAKRYDRVRQVLRLALTAGTALAVTQFALFQLFPRQIIGLFGDGSEAYFTFATSYFRTYLFFTFINHVQPLASSFFTAIGKPARGIILSLTRQVFFLLPLLVLLPYFWGIEGVMYAGPIADAAAAILSAVMLVHQVRGMGTGARPDAG